MPSFHLTIVTPVATRFDGDATSLVAPGEEGFLGVLANHAPLICGLKPGPLSVKTDEGTSWFAMGPGVLEVTQGHGVTILADKAWPETDEAAAKQAVADEYGDA